MYDNNLTITKILEQDKYQMLEAAYLAGFEPSSDYISEDKEIEEALNFLTNKSIRL